VLSRERVKLDAIASALLERETLQRGELEALVAAPPAPPAPTSAT
jgi:ATP-dependent Zn protease